MVVWILIGLAVWLLLSVIVALCLGRVIDAVSGDDEDLSILDPDEPED